jgi:hypothetical protein
MFTKVGLIEIKGGEKEEKNDRWWLIMNSITSVQEQDTRKPTGKCWMTQGGGKGEEV